jgi:kynurenine formamidase
MPVSAAGSQRIYGALKACGIRFIGPACVIDVRREVEADPDFLLTPEHLLAWEDRHGRIPTGAWVLLCTGWSRRADPAAFFNVDERGSRIPSFHQATPALLAHERDVLGVGVETVGTDAGQAGRFDPPFPNHAIMHGAGKFGLASLCNLDRGRRRSWSSSPRRSRSSTAAAARCACWPSRRRPATPEWRSSGRTMTADDQSPIVVRTVSDHHRDKSIDRRARPRARGLAGGGRARPVFSAGASPAGRRRLCPARRAFCTWRS